MVVAVLCFLESKTAPFAGCWAVNMAFIKLDVLDWVAKSKLVDTHASRSVTVNLNNWHRIN